MIDDTIMSTSIQVSPCLWYWLKLTWLWIDLNGLEWTWIGYEFTWIHHEYDHQTGHHHHVPMDTGEPILSKIDLNWLWIWPCPSTDVICWPDSHDACHHHVHMNTGEPILSIVLTMNWHGLTWLWIDLSGLWIHLNSLWIWPPDWSWCMSSSCPNEYRWAHAV